MQILVNIDDNLFNRIKYLEPKASTMLDELMRAVQNGTPLPKGHRFIDADEILDQAFIEDDEEGDTFVQKYYCIKKEVMDNALVLFDTLEADKEQENGISRTTL